MSVIYHNPIMGSRVCARARVCVRVSLHISWAQSLSLFHLPLSLSISPCPPISPLIPPSSLFTRIWSDTPPPVSICVWGADKEWETLSNFTHIGVITRYPPLCNHTAARHAGFVCSSVYVFSSVVEINSSRGGGGISDPEKNEYIQSHHIHLL